jgi:hypothetical protein
MNTSGTGNNKKSQAQVALFAALLAATVSACGGSSAQNSIDPPIGGTGGGTSGGTSGGITGGTTGGTTGGSTGGTTGAPFDAAASFSFTVTGGTRPESVYETPTIHTDTKLRVRVNSGSAGQVRPLDGSYSNYNASYNCVSYTLEIGGRTFQTNYLNAPGSTADCGTSGKPTSQILDLSSFLTPGLGGFSIKVRALHYDAYYQGCLWDPYRYGVNPFQFSWQQSCKSMYFQRSVYQTHTVTGSIEVEVNSSAF